MFTPIEVKPLDNYRLWIKYSDGVEGVVDLSDFAGDGVFHSGMTTGSFKKFTSGQTGRSPGATRLTCVQMLSISGSPTRSRRTFSRSYAN
jgi:hypothetical protein